MFACARPGTAVARPRTAIRRGRPAGFSLVELLVVVGIVGLLAGLSLAAVQKARAAAARAACGGHLRQLALATHMFADVGQALPQGCEYPFGPVGPGPIRGQCGISWQANILPFVEQDELWQRVWEVNQRDPTGYVLVDAHSDNCRRRVPVFVCPADGRLMGGLDTRFGRLEWALTSYLGVAGTRTRANDGAFHPDFAVRLADFTDGTTNTLLMGERPAGPNGESGGWYALTTASNVCPLTQVLPAGPVASGIGFPTGAACRASTPALHPGRVADGCSVGHFWSLHPGGANFAFADGSVRFLGYPAADLLPALATRAGGEVAVRPD